MHSVFYLRPGNAIYLSVYYLMLTKRSYCDLNLGNGYDEANNSPPDISVLNVAENEETAKNIANFLSDGNARIRNGIPHYNKIYEFQHNLEGEKRNMIMTSVSGHLLNFDFTGMYKSWTSCSPASLFEAPLLKTYPMDYEHAYIKHTLETEIQSCDTLIIWTDCDNEGENIGFEIASVCTAINPNITIHRARFSEITAKSVQHAMDNLEKLNKHINNAVDVRSEIDLRIGAAFTRFQTLRLRQVFPNLLRDNVLSYGTLQFPTLGLVVDRYLDIKNFSPEPFWTIKVTHGDNDSVVNFTWKRGQVFNDETCRILYRHCRKVGEATVESIKSKLVHKKGPQPLDTLELQKSASEKLKLTAKTVMDAAEKLYSEGFISFPRSEGSVFPEDIDLQKLVQMQIQDRRWGKFASNLLKKVLYPREGDKHDQFHPPVHPVKYADSLTGIEAVVYEFIVRHFLACVSDDAVGNETVVNIDMDGEKFYARNLSIVERNYLDVYPYDEWPTSELTRSYKEGQRFVPTTLETVSGETLPFKRLTEAELIQNMQEFGIGTIDATYAEAIDKIKSRLYISLQNGTYFIPGPIGMGLVEGYNSMGVHLAEPHQRAELEADLRRVSKGVKDPKTVLVGQLEEYKKQYRIAQRQASKLDTALSHYLPHKPVPFHEEKKASTYSPVMKCPKCGSDIVLKLRPNNTGYYLSCLGFPNCKTSMWFPSNIIKMKVQSTSCSICGPRVKKLKFEFEPGSMHPFYPDTYVGCVNGCDLKLLELLHLRPISTIVQTTPKIEGSGQQSLKSARDVEEDTISQGDQILCGCGLPAVLRTVRKEGRNKGRQFYSCPKPMGQQCNFLEWADKIPADGGSSSRGTNYQPQSLPATDEGIRCKCGLPAIKLTVKKEGRNKGNIFYKCPKPRHQQCDFIEWADNKYAGGGSRTNYQYSAKSKFTARTATDSRGESNRQQNDDEPDAVLCCDCGLPAKKSVVKKLGGNKGREFYGCPNPRNKQCKYFQWADQLPSGTGSKGTNYQPRYNTKSSFSERKATDTGSESSRRQESGSASNNQNNYEPDNTICCNCGLPAKKAVVMRQTQNKGREFYVCPKPKAQQCGFYQWADEVPSGTGPRGTNYQSRYKTKSSFYDRKGSGARSDTQRKSSSWSSSRSSQNVESSDDKELCHCGLPAKIITVTKDSINKGKQFYVCAQPRNQQCKLFKHVKEGSPAVSVKRNSRRTKEIHKTDSIISQELNFLNEQIISSNE